MKIKWILNLAIICFIYSTNIVYSQSWHYYKRLPLIRTTDKQIDSILLETIKSVEKCDYYTKDIAFRIDYFFMQDTAYLAITTSHYRQDIFCASGLSKILGYYKVKKHLVVVFCDENQKLFERTKGKKRFLENNSDKVKLLIRSEYFFWMFIIKENKYYLKDMINECKSYNGK